MTVAAAPQPTDLDRRIWQEELEDFVPRQVFDVHTHIYRWAHNTDPAKEQGGLAEVAGRSYAEATWQLAGTCDAALMPGREVHRLSFPFPFPQCNFAAANAFLAAELRGDPQSAGLLLVHPGMTDDEVEEQLARHGFLGLKPYRFYSATGDAVQCRITDFLPEHQIAVANRLGLIVMLHISKRDAIADADNQRDLRDLAERYPRVQWILAHCARSYSAWAIERAAETLRALPGLWYDTSSVCESDAVAALLDTVGPQRVMYGSDDVPIGVLRGKYVAFGYAWAYLSESNQSLGLSHCDGRMTFTRYEQLRAMRRAAQRIGLTRQQVEDLFCGTARRLVASVRKTSAVRERITQ
jgi:glutamate-1-semialdehyde 2,1-aminomutase